MAIQRGLLFLVICFPFTIWSPHPVVPMLVVIAATTMFLKREGRSSAVLGLELRWRRVSEFIAGFLGGAFLMILSIVAIALILPFPWKLNPAFQTTAAISALCFFLWSNLGEELVFRGYAFERLVTGLGHWKAQIFTALLFALFHILNGWSWSSALIGTTAGSILFGLVFLRWQSLPAATGVHAAGNFIQTLLLSDPPSLATLFGPLSSRPWTPSEQFSANSILIGFSIIASVFLARSLRLRCELLRKAENSARTNPSIN